MKVLITHEASQTVCRAFRELGHEAFSNDLKDCYGGHPEWHMKMDCYKAVRSQKWDLIIAHPECTKLAVSGNATYALGKARYNERREAAKWTQDYWSFCTSNCQKVCFENPIGVLPRMTNLPKPTYIQPFQFGHPEPKKTALFLFGLPSLKPTKIVSPKYIVGKDGKKYSRLHYLTKHSAMKYYGQDRATVRSQTYQGVAKAMALQWGKHNNI